MSAEESDEAARAKAVALSRVVWRQARLPSRESWVRNDVRLPPWEARRCERCELRESCSAAPFPPPPSLSLSTFAAQASVIPLTRALEPASASGELWSTETRSARNSAGLKCGGQPWPPPRSDAKYASASAAGPL